MNADSALPAPVRPERAPAARRAAAPRLSTPREHGGLATIGAGAILAPLVAPRPLVAFVAMCVYALAYMARGPIERWARGAALRGRDSEALAGYAVAAALACAAIAASNAAGALAVGLTAASLPVVGAVVRRRNQHRHPLVEAAGLAACAGAAGVAAYAGGASLVIAAIIAGAAGIYGAASAPLVRAELRKTVDRRRNASISFTLVMLGAIGGALIQPLLGLAFAPRLVHAGYRMIRPLRARRRWVAITREAIQLLVFVVLVALAL